MKKGGNIPLWIFSPTPRLPRGPLPRSTGAHCYLDLLVEDLLLLLVQRMLVLGVL